MTIRVLLADDQALLRGAFRVLIDAEDDMEVVGEAADGRQAVELARATRPDIVLMDIRMPGADGLGATAAICGDEELAGTRVLILTTFEIDEYVAQALRAGAGGFLGKGRTRRNCSPPSAPSPPGTPCSLPPPPGPSSTSSSPSPIRRPARTPRRSACPCSPPASAR